jgi:thymidylate kinase
MGLRMNKVLTSIHDFIERLNGSGIRYCHWKSNMSLEQSLAGKTDIDLLIDRKDSARFRAILSQLHFRPAIATDGEPFPSVEHYYGLDEESGVLVHVHAYFRVVTGESLAKNYRFPIEEMLLSNIDEKSFVRIPTKSAELVVFTLRMMLKHTSAMELFLLGRYWDQAQQEIKWLLETGSTEDALGFVECWLPSIDTSLFFECIAALATPAPLVRRILLAHKLHSQLRSYARHSFIRSSFGEVQKFTVMLVRRLIRSRKGMVPLSGGAVIAFVGSEATGKSSLLAESRRWLGEHFAVEQIHAGKPKSTRLTFIPNTLVPALRAKFPQYRSTHVEAKSHKDEPSKKTTEVFPLMTAIRATLLAYDRRSLLTQAYSQAANGTIVLCDRYPSTQIGAPDSPQLSNLATSSERYSIRSTLATMEARLYREVPSPDLVIYLNAPLEVTISRNANRSKKEPEEYVRWRHARSSGLEFGKAHVCRINTDQPIEQTVLEIKKAIWNAL